MIPKQKYAPKGIVLPDFASILETYSRRTNLSPAARNAVENQLRFASAVMLALPVERRDTVTISTRSHFERIAQKLVKDFRYRMWRVVQRREIEAAIKDICEYPPVSVDRNDADVAHAIRVATRRRRGQRTAHATYKATKGQRERQNVASGLIR